MRLGVWVETQILLHPWLTWQLLLFTFRILDFGFCIQALQNPKSKIRNPIYGAALKIASSCDWRLAISLSMSRFGVWSINLRNLPNWSLALMRLGSQASWFGMSGYLSISSATLQSILFGAVRTSSA